jgi:hypothetical protein
LQVRARGRTELRQLITIEILALVQIKLSIMLPNGLPVILLARGVAEPIQPLKHLRE